jgi:hypothetical protein
MPTAQRAKGAPAVYNTLIVWTMEGRPAIPMVASTPMTDGRQSRRKETGGVISVILAATARDTP